MENYIYYGPYYPIDIENKSVIFINEKKYELPSKNYKVKQLVLRGCLVKQTNKKGAK